MPNLLSDSAYEFNISWCRNLSGIWIIVCETDGYSLVLLKWQSLQNQMKYSVWWMVGIIFSMFLNCFQTMSDQKHTVKWKTSKRKSHYVSLLLLPVKRHIESRSFMRGVSFDKESYLDKLTLKLPQVTKTEFLLTISMLY